MTVRCCRAYEEVHEGDIGRIVKLDRDGLHDLNMQVDWQRKGGTYWVSTKSYINVSLAVHFSCLPNKVSHRMVLSLHILA